MRFRFTTSLPGLMEGREIDVDPPFGPDVEAYIRTGVLVPVRGVQDDHALAPAAVEHAIARRTETGRRKGRTGATAVADGVP